MSEFVVSARKYRPQKFSEVVGQAHVSQTLKNALRTDHVAHAFLFCGPRGVGKTTNARILAKILNCTNRTPEFEACNECSSCQSFNQSASFNIFELDAASNNSVEHIRSLVEQTRIPPQQGKYKVFIIDEVHMLSSAAFNAFLKTLEEPPAHAIFILATTEKHKIIPTILSRCQIFDFRRIQIPDTVEHLQKICTTEGIQADADALHIIAQKSDGALRDALSIFDRIVSASTDKTISYADVIENLNVLDYDYFFKLTDALLSEDLPTVFTTFDDVMRRGFDPDIFIGGLAEHFRNVLVCKDIQTLQLLEVGENLKARYQQQATLSSTSFVLTALNLCNDCDINFKMARNKRLHVEMALVKMTYIGRALDLSAQPMSLEKKTADRSNVVVPPTQPSVVATPTPKSEAQSNPTPQYPTVEIPLSTANEPEKDIAEDVSISVVASIPQSNEAATSAPSSDEPPRSGLSTVKSVSLGLSTMPKIGSLDAIAAMIQEEEKILQQSVSKLSYENLVNSWKKYTETHESPSTKYALQTTKLGLEDKKIVAKVGSTLMVGMIQQENKLAEFLRFDLNDAALMLEVTYDPALAPEESESAAPPKRYLTPRDKLRLMMEVNPLVKDMAFRLNLKPDE
ncbi:MAG: DNA polymerase III subunit gamma/tau [Saprospiraceae bacterium]|nr:DNA polymerase III subunit gamma/tau [Saprospiraceae bacterium]